MSQKYYSDRELARRLDRSEGYSGAMFVEARAQFFPELQPEWFEVGGVYVLFDGPDSPVTQTFGLGLSDPIGPAELERIERFFVERGSAVNHDVSPLSGVALANLLSERGYRPVEFASAMYRPIESGANMQPNEQIDVRKLGDDEGELFVEICQKGWGHIPGLSDFWQGMIPISTGRKDSVTFVAELEGAPVATGVLCFHEGVALLGGACTIPEARRHGAQLALLDARMRHAAERGCDLAMMCAEPSSASQRNAERHGFRIAYTRTKWQLSLTR